MISFVCETKSSTIYIRRERKVGIFGRSDKMMKNGKSGYTKNTDNRFSQVLLHKAEEISLTSPNTPTT